MRPPSACRAMPITFGIITHSAPSTNDCPHPVDHLGGPHPGQEAEVAQHHQALDVVGVGPALDAVDGRRDAAHARRRARQRGRQGALGAERVLVAHAGHPQPVDAPHVLAPADHLADEALGRGDRHGPRAVRLLHRVAHLARVDHPEVQVGGDGRVGQPPLPVQHRVLVGAEAGQVVRDEGPQPRERAAARDRPPRRDPPPRAAVARRGRAVLGIEVPAAAGGRVAVHQVAEPAALLAVEVLHPQAAAALRRPGGEVLVVAEELVRAHRPHPEPLQHAHPVPGHRLHRRDLVRSEGAPVVPQPGGEAGSLAQIDREPLRPQLARELRHGVADQAEPLRMEALGAHLGPRVHHQDPGPGGIAALEAGDAPVELVAQHPDRAHQSSQSGPCARSA